MIGIIGCRMTEDVSTDFAIQTWVSVNLLNKVMWIFLLVYSKIYRLAVISLKLYLGAKSGRDNVLTLFLKLKMKLSSSPLQDGQQYGDEYLAELDYIEVVEKHKEGYESEVVDPDEDSSDDSSSSSGASLSSDSSDR